VQGREQNMETLRDEKFIEKLLDRPVFCLRGRLST
jgi:hypothetical protein